MQPIFDLGQSGLKFHALEFEGTLVLYPSIKGNIISSEGREGQAQPEVPSGV